MFFPMSRYKLFKFKLLYLLPTIQVNNNLFSFCKPASSRMDEDTPTSPTPSSTKFYVSELQRQYATVMSKPSSSTKNRNLFKGRVDPKFYNVRPMGGVNITEEAESIETQTVDEEVIIICQCEKLDTVRPTLFL